MFCCRSIVRAIPLPFIAFHLGAKLVVLWSAVQGSVNVVCRQLSWLASYDAPIVLEISESVPLFHLQTLLSVFCGGRRRRGWGG